MELRFLLEHEAGKADVSGLGSFVWIYSKFHLLKSYLIFGDLLMFLEELSK